MRSESGGEIVAKFRLSTRCHNCRAKTARVIEVPDAEDAPTEPDDLLASAFLARLPFRCGKCENPIGTILSVSPLPLH